MNPPAMGVLIIAGSSTTLPLMSNTPPHARAELWWRLAIATCWIWAALALGWLGVASYTARTALQVMLSLLRGRSGEWSFPVLATALPVLLVSLVPLVLARQRVRLALAMRRRETSLRNRLRTLGGQTAFLNGLGLCLASWLVAHETREPRWIAAGLALVAAAGILQGMLLLNISRSEPDQ